MARKSRRNKEVIEVKERVNEILNERKVKVGGYVRLSNNKNDTDSIETQTLMIQQYVNGHAEMEIGDFYVDDGFSGTDFARPGIIRLIDDVKSGKIECIIVKDFSRFGRNYLEVGYYLETVFPCLGVRFISINDRYDSSKEEDQNGMLISIKNLLNSMYAVDTSKKLARTFELQRQTGTVKYKRPIIGYDTTKDKLSLTVDPVAARTVKLLFYWYSRGYSTSEIAKKLNILQFNTPWDYLAKKHHYNERTKKTNVGWRTEPILCILRNQEYIGNKVNGKVITRLTEISHTTYMPPEKWIIEENAHEPIVSRILFDAVNKKMTETKLRIVSERSRYAENRDNYNNILLKRVVCGDCGKVMAYYRKGYYCYGLQEAYYTCSPGNDGECHHVVYEDLEQILPALQVRLIAINSRYDSKDMGADILSLDVGMQNIINNMYSKDLSRKISGAFRAKWEAGENPSGHVAYGYYIDENHKIQIDPESAPVVKLIFDFAEEGRSTLEIAESLNSRGYLSPLMYKLKKTGRAIPKNIRNPKEQLWSTRSVANVIHNYDYTGARVHGKREHYMVGECKTRKAPRNRQVVVENDHPAIVSKEKFASAQMAIKEVSPRKGWNSYEDAFSKKIRCGCCGNLLQLTRTDKNELFCEHSREIGTKSKCNTDTYDRRLIISLIINALRERIIALSKVHTNLSKQAEAMFTNATQRKKEIDLELKKMSDELARKYEDFANGRITREMFIEIKNRLSIKKEILIQQEKEEYTRKSSAENTLFELSRTVNMGQTFFHKSEITPEIVDAFIDEVFVHAQDRIDIHFKTKDLYERALLEIQEIALSSADMEKEFEENA